MTDYIDEIAGLMNNDPATIQRLAAQNAAKGQSPQRVMPILQNIGKGAAAKGILLGPQQQQQQGLPFDPMTGVRADLAMKGKTPLPEQAKQPAEQKPAPQAEPPGRPKLTPADQALLGVQLQTPPKIRQAAGNPGAVGGGKLWQAINPMPGPQFGAAVPGLRIKR